MPTSSLLTSLATGGSFPLDSKLYSLTLVDMTDLGISNFRAYGYYEDMKVWCVEDHIEYIWREEVIENELGGILSEIFIYPPGVISNNIDYSGRKFNFFNILSSLQELQIFDSIIEAFESLGPGRKFYWSQENKDGATSPNNSLIGITK
jgi:hypothetical protein